MHGPLLGEYAFWGFTRFFGNTPENSRNGRHPRLLDRHADRFLVRGRLQSRACAVIGLRGLGDIHDVTSPAFLHFFQNRKPRGSNKGGRLLTESRARTFVLEYKPLIH